MPQPPSPSEMSGYCSVGKAHLDEGQSGLERTGSTQKRCLATSGGRENVSLCAAGRAKPELPALLSTPQTWFQLACLSKPLHSITPLPPPLHLPPQLPIPPFTYSLPDFPPLSSSLPHSLRPSTPPLPCLALSATAPSTAHPGQGASGLTSPR